MRRITLEIKGKIVTLCDATFSTGHPGSTYERDMTREEASEWVESALGLKPLTGEALMLHKLVDAHRAHE